MLRDLGHFTWLPDGECYRTTYTHEMVQLDGRKMSKHLGNTVTPHEIVEQLGADTLRFATLHAAAPAKAFTWDESLLTYSSAFLRRLWAYAEPRLSAASGPPPELDLSDGLRRRLAAWCDTAVTKITENYERLDMHRATRNLMALFERIEDFEARVAARREPTSEDRDATVYALGLLLRLLAPVAPHIAEELWALSGSRRVRRRRRVAEPLPHERAAAPCGRSGSPRPRTRASSAAGTRAPASARSRGASSRDEEPRELVYFPPELVPVAQHALVQELGADTVDRVLIQQLHTYLEFTSELEHGAVNPVAAMISRRRSGFDLPETMIEDAYKIYTDEAWHAQFSDDLGRQVAVEDRRRAERLRGAELLPQAEGVPAGPRAGRAAAGDDLLHDRLGDADLGDPLGDPERILGSSRPCASSSPTTPRTRAGTPPTSAACSSSPGRA